jgi:hypothetical protein
MDCFCRSFIGRTSPASEGAPRTWDARRIILAPGELIEHAVETVLREAWKRVLGAESACRSASVGCAAMATLCC